MTLKSTAPIETQLKNGVTIKLLGDSITAGGGSSDNNRSGEVFACIGDKEYRRQQGKRCWASQFESYIADKYPNSRVINNGCSDITSKDLVNNMDQLYSEVDDMIIIMIGTNDRKVENGMVDLYNNLIEIVHYLKQQDKIVILMSPNPSTIQNESYSNRLYHLDDVNNTISQVAMEEELLFISHYNYIYNYSATTSKSIEELMLRDDYRTDGLHPSDEVHVLIFRNLLHNLGLDYRAET